MNGRVRVGFLAFLGLVVMLAAPTGLRAQDFGLELVDAGKPVPNAEVLLLVNAAKVPLGTTDASGHLTVAMNRADIPRGTPVDVYEIECDGEVVVVIVGPGEREQLEEECERRRRENPNCTCRRIGGFLWGEDVTIDVGRGQVVPRTADRMDYGYGDGRLVQFGGGIGYSRWPHLDRACNLDGVMGCELSDDRAMFQAILEWYWLSRIGVGFEVNYTPGLEVHHTSFETGGGFPSRSVTELDVLGAGFLGLVRLPLRSGRTAVFAAFGPMWTVNLGDVRSDYGSRGVFEESRHDPGLRLGGRAGLDWRFGDGPWGSRFEIGGMTGEDPDIDTSWFLGWKLLYHLWGTEGGV